MEVVATLTSDVSRIYFISWYVVAVVVMSNLVVAQVRYPPLRARAGGLQ